VTESPNGWRDWTRTGGESGEGFAERIARLEKNFRTHLGIDFSASGIDYPHPSQKVRTLYFFEGDGRLDPTGIQISPLDSVSRGIYWVDEFSDDPNGAAPSMSVVGISEGSPSIYSLVSESFYDADNLSRISARSTADQGFGQIAAESGGNVGRLSFFAGRTGIINSRLTLESPDLAGVTIEPAGLTADPLFPVDGQLFWRSDTNRYRVRLGGTYYNLATTADIPTILPSNVTPLATKTTTYTTTNADGVILCDATSGAFTVTLVSAVGNTGLTQTFKKIDSGANVVTVDANSTQTIDGVLSMGLSAQWTWFTAVSDGSNWMIVGQG